MGEQRAKLVAQKKLLAETKQVTIDVAEVAFVMSEADTASLSENGDSPNIGALRVLLQQVIAAEFKDGMNRRDGKLWAGWQEVLSQKGSTAATITHGQLSWMFRLISKDELKLAAGLAQWREVLCDYLETLSGEINKGESPTTE